MRIFIFNSFEIFSGNSFESISDNSFGNPSEIAFKIPPNPHFGNLLVQFLWLILGISPVLFLKNRAVTQFETPRQFFPAYLSALFVVCFVKMFDNFFGISFSNCLEIGLPNPVGNASAISLGIPWVIFFPCFRQLLWKSIWVILGIFL